MDPTITADGTRVAMASGIRRFHVSQAHLATGSESFVIVANGEHLSMSPAGAALPPGWHVVSEPRSKTACLDHIGTVCSGFNRPPSVPPLAPGSNLTH